MQVRVCFSRAVQALLLVFVKVEGILIIPLEKWKFVHKLRWKKDVVCLIER